MPQRCTAPLGSNEYLIEVRWRETELTQLVSGAHLLSAIRNFLGLRFTDWINTYNCDIMYLHGAYYIITNHLSDRGLSYWV